MRTFNYNGHLLREFDGWISATDIAKILDYSNVSILCTHLGDDRKYIKQGGQHGPYGLLVVNRNGLRRIAAERWEAKAILSYADHHIFCDATEPDRAADEFDKQIRDTLIELTSLREAGAAVKIDDGYICPRCNMDVKPDFNYCPYCSQAIRF